MPEKADRILKLLKYIILLFIVIGIWTLGLVTFDSTSNPWTIFGMYASIKGWPEASYLLTAGAGLLLLIIAGSMFVERFFCRYICPLGAVYALISRPSLFKIKKPREQCGSCRACTTKCTMGIPLYKYDVVHSGECINCFACIEACPRKNATFVPLPAVAASIAIILIAG